jgi:hypothetical protein
MVIVLTVVAFACEAPARAERASKKPPAENAARSQVFFITEKAPENFPGKARQGVWGLMEVPFSGEGVLFLSEVLGFKRFFREKSVEFAIASQGPSIAANAPVGVFSRPKVTSLIVRLFSAHIAVRK